MREGEQILIILLTTHTFFSKISFAHKNYKTHFKSMYLLLNSLEKNGKGIESKKMDNVKLQYIKN